MKLISIDPNTYGDAIVTFKRKRMYGWRNVEIVHADKGGAPVRKGHSSWRTVCGIAVQGRRWNLIIQFRRFWTV